MIPDSWSSVASESYVTVAAHDISEDWQIVLPVLLTGVIRESHMGDHLAELLARVVDEWQLSEKDAVLVTVFIHENIALYYYGK